MTDRDFEQAAVGLPGRSGFYRRRRSKRSGWGCCARSSLRPTPPIARVGRSMIVKLRLAGKQGGLDASVPRGLGFARATPILSWRAPGRRSPTLGGVEGDGCAVDAHAREKERWWTCCAKLRIPAGRSGGGGVTKKGRGAVLSDWRLRRSATLITAAACVACLLVAGGCGASDPNALLVTALHDAAAARSFRMTGSGVSPRFGRMEFDVDLAPGRGLRGTYTLRGVHLAVISVNGTIYLRLRASRNARFLNAVLPRSLSTRWIETSSPEITTALARIDAIRYAFRTATTRGVQSDPTTVDGVSAVRFEDPLGRGAVTVGKGPRPYPLTLVNRSLQVHASFSRWNERIALSPPANAVSANQLRRPKVTYRTIANASVLPSQPHGGVRTFRAVGYAIAFEYPAALFVVPLGSERIAGQYRSASHVALALNPYSMIAVSRFGGLPIPIRAANIRVLYQPFARAVNALAGQPVATSFASVHGIPLLRFAPFTATLQGTPLTERIFNGFVGDDEYEMRCQFAPADAQTIEQACAKMMSTLAHTRAPAP